MILDFPHDTIRISVISWTPETNHGALVSPFTGAVTVQRGQLERWRFETELLPHSLEEAEIVQGFFLQLEGAANLFRMYDPAGALPRGQSAGAPVLDGAHPAGARSLLTAGWAASVLNQLRAGDWLQIGNQLLKVTDSVHSDIDGKATVPIWPALWLDQLTEAPIITRYAKGIFRMVAEHPSWSISAANRTRPYTFRLSGVQDIYLAE
jgi:hypothetical protein